MEIHKNKLNLFSYRFILMEILLGTIALTALKVTTAIIPIFLYLLSRQLFIYCFLLINDRKGLISFSKKFLSLGGKERKVIVVMIILRGFNILLAYYCFDKLNLSEFSFLEMPITLIVTLIVSIILLKEKFKVLNGISTLVLILGISLVSFNGDGVSNISFAIILLLIVNALTLALYSYYSEIITHKLDVNEFMIISAVSPILPLFLASLFFGNFNDLSFVYELDLLLYFLIIVAFSISLINNIMLVKSIREIGATRTSMTRPLIIVTSLLSAIFIIGEPFSGLQLLGAFVTLVGVLLFTKARL